MGLLKNSSFFLACTLGFAQFFTRTGSSHSLVPLYADRIIGLSPSELGLFFAGASLLHGLLVYPAGAIADKFGRKAVIIPGNIGVVAALIMFPHTEGVWLFAIGFILLHGATGYGGQAPVAYMGDIAPANARGVSFGL